MKGNSYQLKIIIPFSASLIGIATTISFLTAPVLAWLVHRAMVSGDAGVVHWLENKEGETLSVGRKTRTIPPAIRRALQRRDKGCCFPGCSCSRFVDAHHIRHWADGGETSMSNLALLCRRHHRMVHEEGFAIHSRADGRIYFTDPQGQHLPDAGETRSSGNVFALTTGNRLSGLNISPETGKCQWGGEQMDDDLAILCILQLE